MKGLFRAMLAHCPHCGEKRIWQSFGETVANCPTCGYRYEREEGYWVGAMIVSIGAVMITFMAVFVGGMLITWPDVPWNTLLILTASLMVLMPIVFYRQTKTIWVWLDLKVHPYEGDERDWEQR